MTKLQGINFRVTSGFVTDGTGDTYEINDTLDYPRTTPQGVAVGWEQSISSGRDRNSGIDARLAGLALSSSSTNGGVQNFRIDLDASGSHDITVAAGDGSYTTHVKVELFDGTTSLGVLVPAGSTSAGNKFFDATGTEYSAAAWPGSNTAVTKTFAGTICRFRVGDGTNSCAIAHVAVTTAASASGSATGTATGVASASGVGASLAASTGSATGLASASGVGASIAASTGSCTGLASVSGIGASIAASTGSATGVASASGVGSSTSAGAATGTALGVATASGVGAWIFASTGTALGLATASGVAPNIVSATGTALGSATALGVGQAFGLLWTPVLPVTSTWTPDSASADPWTPVSPSSNPWVSA